MAVTTFAAIDISSYEITMKILNFQKDWFPDCGRYPVSSESWSRGIFSGTMEVDKVDTICEVLNDFKEDHGRVRCERLPRLYHKCFP